MEESGILYLGELANDDLERGTSNQWGYWQMSRAFSFFRKVCITAATRIARVFVSKNKHHCLNSFASVITHDPEYVLFNLKSKQLLKHLDW